MKSYRTLLNTLKSLGSNVAMLIILQDTLDNEMLLIPICTNVMMK